MHGEKSLIYLDDKWITALLAIELYGILDSAAGVFQPK